ncbi:hypothetical protein TVAG_111460 [Trichomonas vaginalis G3]|uniref:Uncharacterized protein n=1 Tax=Trichomonas vaginalis (strain ATCC PRA-98 / G3) TaxID=412133 RepID=A2F005_TRIV3|nr:hypothetical protein TVAGG3_0144630 [Trichomonas vaginalis G3]EAY01789.1 hypothetical protein TVAG_111460 [Trichomonas vaginalis G3]KAI5546829.1 hypothetical protein TVAGG3_0144630 [Trichomonas vaginalis G3]|eukprot:XP_001314347.1 hypothetical protein [Trichomonas vaginalis G3]
MEDYSLKIDENVIIEIKEFIAPSIAFYYENKQEILDIVMVLYQKKENSLQGFYNLASISMKLNEEKPRISDILVYLGTRNKKFSMKCYYSSKVLSNDHECIKTIYDNFISIYLDQSNENKFENEFKKLSLLLISSLQFNSILFNDQFTLLYGEKYRELNIQTIKEKISKYDNEIEITKSDIKLSENYQSFVDEIKSFDDIPIAEYISLALGGLTSKYIELIQSQTESQEMKSQAKSIFYKLIENYQQSYFITNFVSNDLISLF